MSQLITDWGTTSPSRRIQWAKDVFKRAKDISFWLNVTPVGRTVPGGKTPATHGHEDDEESGECMATGATMNKTTRSQMRTRRLGKVVANLSCAARITKDAVHSSSWKCNHPHSERTYLLSRHRTDGIQACFTTSDGLWSNCTLFRAVTTSTSLGTCTKGWWSLVHFYWFWFILE